MTKTRALFGIAASLVAGAYVVDHLGWSHQPPPEPPPEPTAAATDLPVGAIEIGELVRMAAAVSADFVPAGAADELYLRIDLDAAERPGARGPVALAMVMDRSGSMDEGDYDDLEQPTKMQQTKAAAIALIDRLAPDDMLAIISYSDTAEVNQPLRRVGDVGKAQLRRLIETIYAHGGTNIGAGIDLAVKQLAKTINKRLTKRLVLMSDGHANYGETDDRALAQMAAAALAGGVSVSALGVGLDFNETLMVMVAENGGGAFHYAKDAEHIGPALAGELDHLARSAARQVDVALELPEGVTLERVFGFAVSRRAGRWVVHVGDMAGGEHRQVIVKVATSPSQPGLRPLARLDLSYGVPSGDMRRHHVGDLSVATTDDPLAIRRGVRPTVMAGVVAAKTAQARREAATEFAAGRSARAKARLQKELEATSAMGEAVERGILMHRVAELEETLQQLNDLSASSDDGRNFAKQQQYDARIQMTY